MVPILTTRLVTWTWYCSVRVVETTLGQVRRVFMSIGKHSRREGQSFCSPGKIVMRVGLHF